ncbi:hypothetical protein Tco_1576757 [Tanacetum coccineum]
MVQAKVSKECLDVVKSLMACKLKPRASICAFCLRDERGLNESRRLKHGELNLVMGNRKIAALTGLEKYEAQLKSGVRVDLNN